MNIRLSSVVILALLLFLTGCLSSTSSPYGYGGAQSPYSTGGYYGGSGYDYRYDRNRREQERLERERIQLERERVELERERLEHEKHHGGKYRPRPPAVPLRPPSYTPQPNPPKKRPDRCPSGFSPSEDRCTSKERRKGCQDMRTAGGLGCVSSRFR